MRRSDGGTRLNCFSPPVMMATFIIEIVMAAYTLWRYKLDVLGRLIVSTLVFLALFQLSEYFVCGGWGLRASEWSRTGYVAITTLPVIGLHILHVLAGKPKRRLVAFAYISMAGFIAYFLAYPSVFTGYACTGNYVIFQLGSWATRAYSAYYYGWLLTALGLGIHWANQLKAKGKSAAVRLETVRALIVGYLVFLIPTALANSIKPSTRQGIPSIMCGFAVLFAFILVGYVLPRAAKLRRT